MVQANAIIDIIPYADSLWLAGYTEPRLLGEYMRGDKGVLFRFDGQTVQKTVELDACEGIVGLTGYAEWLYFGTFTGEIYRLQVPPTRD